MVRIGLDARLTYYTQAGIAQYTQHLIRELAAADAANDYLLLHSRKDKRDLSAGPNQRHVACWTPAHHRLERHALAVELLPHRLDLLHSPDFIPPNKWGFRSVITVHDVAFLHYPQFMTADSRRYYNHQIASATRRADHIIAVSAATRDDLLSMLNVPAEKITVVHEAAAGTYHPLPAEDDAKHLAKFDLTPGYILFVGTIEPRKNLPALLHAYKLLLNDLPDAPRLVIAGGRGWLADDVFETLDALKLGERVRWLGAVEQTDLLPLYSGAALLCMPSHYEGFGLPALEAMACGTPVVVSDRASLPEIAGDAGLLVDPDDQASIADALRRVLTDSSLAKTLREKGIARAKTFSWRRAARETVSVYQKMLETK